MLNFENWVINKQVTGIFFFLQSWDESLDENEHFQWFLSKYK